jgi:hypothetical protein
MLSMLITGAYFGYLLVKAGDVRPHRTPKNGVFTAKVETTPRQTSLLAGG